MKRSPSLSILSAAFFLIASSLFATRQLVQPLSEPASFSMSIPDGWKVQKRVVEGSLNLRVKPEEKGDFLVLITMLPTAGNSPLSTPGAVRAAVAEQGAAELPGALQTKLELVELKMSGGAGTLFHVTDRNQEKGPGDYRELHQGMMLVGKYLAAVTVLTHPGDEATVKQAIEMLESASIVDTPVKTQ